MGKFPAKIVSYLLHPLVMPSLLYFFIMEFLPEALHPMSGRVMLYILLLIFITTFVIPLFSMFGLRTTSTISNLTLEDRKERIVPFIFITLFYGLTTYLFYSKIHVNDFLMSIFVGATAVVAIITVITVFMKISVHSAGAGCLMGSFLAVIYLFPETDLVWPFIIITMLTGIIISARLELGVHNTKEVYSGFGLGFVTCYASIFLLA